MPRAARHDGDVRRASIAVHLRLQSEIEARKAGLQIISWRGTRPVIRIPARTKP